jgi:hypothetical protein
MNLNTVQEIERAIDSLSHLQREELYAWFEEHYLPQVDIELKTALDAGRFDELINHAIADRKSGETQPL